LTIAFRELQGEIGLQAGWGRGTYFGDPDWAADGSPQGSQRKQQAIDSATKKGMRRFYFSAMAPGEATAHDWSFLRPTASLALPAGGTEVQLPEDFAGLEGTSEILASSTETMPRPLQVVGVGKIRSAFADQPSETGPPRMVAVAPLKGTAFNAGQRFQLQIYPLADQAYTLEVEYYILPDYLSGALPFAYGGTAHSGTILEACLAAWERDMDGKIAEHEAHYQQLLAASISYDRNLKAQVIGFNLDGSDDRGRRRNRREYEGAFATFSGVLYDGNP
jgi:hypothetical protein